MCLDFHPVLRGDSLHIQRIIEYEYNIRLKFDETFDRLKLSLCKCAWERRGCGGFGGGRVCVCVCVCVCA